MSVCMIEIYRLVDVRNRLQGGRHQGLTSGAPPFVTSDPARKTSAPADCTLLPVPTGLLNYTKLYVT